MSECPEATVAYAATIINERLAVAVDRLIGEYREVRETFGKSRGPASISILILTKNSVMAVTDKI